MHADHEARITALEKHCAGITSGMNRLTLLIICILIVQIIAELSRGDSAPDARLQK